MMKFKRIYVEITNYCNLDCTFCPDHKRNTKSIDPIQAKNIFQQIAPYTKHIYLHVKGEPLLSIHLKEILDEAYRSGLRVYLVTNGLLLKDHMDLLTTHPAIAQIIVSLHSWNEVTEKIRNEAIVNLCEFVKKIDQQSGIHLQLRFWDMKHNVLSVESEKIMNNILTILSIDKEKFIKQRRMSITKIFHISTDEQFEWPDLENIHDLPKGMCHGGTLMMVILADGTISPCCLDGDGVIQLGNIYTDGFEKAITSPRYLTMIDGFHKRHCTEDLCRHCTYKLRFNK